MSPIPERSADVEAPDPEYLDTFLQGARFALFALEGRLRDADAPVPRELDAALDEFHDLYESTRSGLDARQARIDLLTSFSAGHN